MDRKKDDRSSAARSREERRASELSSLSAASSAYSSALDAVSDAVKGLMRGAHALDMARAASVSPDLVQYGVLSRLRPASLQRAVHSVSRELRSKVSLVRSSDLSVPDGSEEAYGVLVSRLASASDLIASALDEFGRSVPVRSGRPHPALRDLILAASGGAALLNRLVGRGRASASVHVSAVRDEISSGKSVSFY